MAKSGRGRCVGGGLREEGFPRCCCCSAGTQPLSVIHMCIIGLMSAALWLESVPLLQGCDSNSSYAWCKDSRAILPPNHTERRLPVLMK